MAKALFKNEISKTFSKIVIVIINTFSKVVIVIINTLMPQQLTGMEFKSSKYYIQYAYVYGKCEG